MWCQLVHCLLSDAILLIASIASSGPLGLAAATMAMAGPQHCRQIGSLQTALSGRDLSHAAAIAATPEASSSRTYDFRAAKNNSDLVKLSRRTI